MFSSQGRCWQRKYDWCEGVGVFKDRIRQLLGHLVGKSEQADDEQGRSLSVHILLAENTHTHTHTHTTEHTRDS